jgi:hypothetical protein
MRKIASRSVSGLIVMAGSLLAITTCLLGLLTYGVVHEAIERHLDYRTRAEAQALLAAAYPEGIAGVRKAVLQRESSHTAGDLGYILVNASGQRIAGSLKADVPPPGFTEFVHYQLSNGSFGIAQAFNATIPGGGQLVVAADRSEIDQMDRIIFAMFGTAVGLIIFTGIGSAIAMHRLVRRRLSVMGATAEAIMGGDLSQRMPLLGDREFDQVSHVINDMLHRIEILLGHLRQLSADIAHDIRSPLNRVRGALEATGQASETNDVTPAAIAVQEIDDLLELLDGVLGISEIEGFAVRKRFRALDMCVLAADVADGYHPVVEAGGMKLLFCGDPVTVMGDEALLRRCLANLIDNAVLHGTGATRITISVVHRATHCMVSVQDDGAGVPAAALDTIFHRFVRLEASQSTMGHGLGLNMVKAIAKAHFGDATAHQRQHGFVVEVCLPATAARPSHRPKPDAP